MGKIISQRGRASLNEEDSLTIGALLLKAGYTVTIGMEYLNPQTKTKKVRCIVFEENAEEIIDSSDDT